MPDPVSNTFAALADPTRRAILARLTLGEASVTDLAQPFHMSMPAVSKHLRVLERAGLVSRSREAQYRPVRLRAQPLQQAATWIEDYRRFWEQSFDRLDDLLAQIQSTPAPRSTAPDTPAKTSTQEKPRARQPRRK